MFVSNNKILVIMAKKCYEEFPTIVNALKESGIGYNNTMSDYAEMDNKFAKSRTGIGESSNLAQLALSYYWTEKKGTEMSKELYDNFVILSVLAQVLIDSCKRLYEVDGVDEIKRIRTLPCMNREKEVLHNIIDEETGEIINQCVEFVKKDFPKFFIYTRDIEVTKNGKERSQDDINADKNKINDRIDKDIICPMNWLEEVLDGIKGAPKTTTTPISSFFIKMKGTANNRQMSTIKNMVEEFNYYMEERMKYTDDLAIIDITNASKELIDKLSKIKIGNVATINRIIEIALGLDSCRGNTDKKTIKEIEKISRKMINYLYKMNKEKFLSNFIAQEL